MLESNVTPTFIIEPYYLMKGSLVFSVKLNEFFKLEKSI